MARKAKGNKLNMNIAKTHRYGSQLVGLQMTSGNIIAICLSVAQIVAGLATLTWETASATNMYLAIAACAFVGAFGAFLALLIERFSLGGLKSIYTANKRKHELEDDYYSRLERGEIPQEQLELAKSQFERLLKRHKTDIILSVPVVVVGVLISGGLGDVFWHMIFASTGPILVWPLSIGVAAIISLTFVYSELYKDIQDESLKETVSDTDLFEEVLAHEKTSIQLDMYVEAIDNIRTDPTKREKALKQVEDSLVEQLTNFSTRVIEEKQAPALNAPQHPQLPAGKQDQAQEDQAIEGQFTEQPTNPGTASNPHNVSVSLPRVALPPATPRPVAPQIPDDPESDEQIIVSVVELDEFSRHLYRDILRYSDLVERIRNAAESFEHLEEATPSVADFLRNEYPDSAHHITDERVERIVRKLIHEADTEPLAAAAPQPGVGEMLGINNVEQLARAVKWVVRQPAVSFDDYVAGRPAQSAANPNTGDDVHTLTPEPEANPVQQQQQARPHQPRAAAQSSRRKRQMTGVQSAPRDGYTMAKPKIKKYLEKKPDINDINYTQFAAFIGRDRRTAKAYITRYLADHQPVQQ
jgi:hypothetical protein